MTLKEAILSQKKDISGFIATNILRIIFFFLIAFLIFIIGKLLYEGAGAISWNFIFGSQKSDIEQSGIGFAIFGTIALSITALLTAAPLGICAAVYLSEFARDNILTKIMRASIFNLAGVPSIVFGLFGLGFFVLFIGKNIDSAIGAGRLFGQPVLLWASLTIAILTLPTIIVAVMEALSSIPDSYREAALALGASKWETVIKAVLPQSKSGILTGIILALSRGAGETAPILFLGCAFFMPNLPIAYIDVVFFALPLLNPMDQFMALPYHIFILSSQASNPETALPAQYATAFVLTAMTFLLNLTAIIFRYKFRKIIDRNIGSI